MDIKSLIQFDQIFGHSKTKRIFDLSNNKNGLAPEIKPGTATENGDQKMGRKLSQMTLTEVQAEMSIAGNPEKVGAMMREMLAVMIKIDTKNAAELTNLEFALQRLVAELKTWKRIYQKRTGQKIH